MKGIKKLLSYVTKVEYAIMIVAFVAMVTAYFVAVVNRNFIKASMPWTEEVAMYSMIYMALLGTEVGLRDGTQVAVTAIIEKLHGITKKVVSIVEQIVLEIFTAVMLKAGTALFLKQIQTGQTTPVLKIPMSAMYFSLVLTFGLILLIQTVILVEKIMDLKNKEMAEMSYCRSSGFHLPGSGFPLLRSIRRSVRFLHRYCTAYLRRTAVYFHYGHRFLRTRRKSDDQRWYLPSYRKFRQLPGRQCARRNEPGTGFSLRILRSLIRFRSCNCYCYRYHALQ